MAGACSNRLRSHPGHRHYRGQATRVQRCGGVDAGLEPLVGDQQQPWNTPYRRPMRTPRVRGRSALRQRVPTPVSRAILKKLIGRQLKMYERRRVSAARKPWCAGAHHPPCAVDLGNAERDVVSHVLALQRHQDHSNACRARCIVAHPRRRGTRRCGTRRRPSTSKVVDCLQPWPT